jgi:predicted DCC family thiol-disulfide oxidoreductase YuxK
MAKIKFAPLQSPLGKYYCKKHELSVNDVNSVVYIEGEKHFLKSSAILHLFKVLNGGWKLLYCLIIIPGFIRDFFYDLVAHNRYRIFGRVDSCETPSSYDKEHFLY